MYTRTAVKPGDRIANGMLHPNARRVFEVVTVNHTPNGTPTDFVLYNLVDGTLGTDTLYHPGWIITPKDAQ